MRGASFQKSTIYMYTLNTILGSTLFCAFSIKYVVLPVSPPGNPHVALCPLWIGCVLWY